jgi:predicted transcriptional regulator
LPRRASELPTEVELEILRVLWEQGQSTVREVWDVISQARRVAYTTVQTMLQVMVRKRVAAVDRGGRAYVYRPRESRDLVARRMVTHLVNRVADGSVPQLLSYALDGRRMLPEEIKAMRWLVDEAERRMEGDRR